MMTPPVATLVGVPAVSVTPLDCAGPNACDIVSVYTSVFWIAMVVLVIVGGLLVYAALRFRRTDDREPAQVHGNPRLEIVWTAVPLVIVSFLFVRTTLRMDYVRNGPPPQQTVQVTGIQWAWSFKYPNGKTSISTLTIPVGQVIRLQVTSKDVLHSFWVPRLGGQIYAKPGFQNSGWIEASQPGTYYGQCNELCGLYHFSMTLQVNAVSAEQYQAFLSGAPPPGGAAAEVNVGETDALKFEPTTATAKIGDVIQWKNNGSLVHNVVFDNGQVPSSETMNQSDTFEVKFTRAGTYSYVCKFHEANNMRGTITVSGG